MTYKNIIELAILFAFVLFVSSEELDLQIFKNVTAIPDEHSRGNGNNLALNLFNVTLHIESFSGNRISIVQNSHPNGGSSNNSECNNTASEGVFWRPWNGTIPEDALIGGMKYNWTTIPVYMGQMVLVYNYNGRLGGMQPVRIYKDSVSVTASFWKLHNSTHHVNILCANDPKLVTWRPVNSTWLSADNKDLVVAGVENDNNGSLFFGRTIYNNELIIGKITLGGGMMFPYNDKELGISSNLEILTYNKNHNQEAIPEAEYENIKTI